MVEQFTYTATDRMGNVVDGKLQAVDHADAVKQIRKQGLSPVGVQLSVPAAKMATAVESPSRSNRPAPIDLTQPVVYMPEAAADKYLMSDDERPMLIEDVERPDIGLAAHTSISNMMPEKTEAMAAATSAEELAARMSHLEPWERAEISARMDPAADTTVQMAPQRVHHRTKTVRGLEKMDFGANSSRQVSISQRFSEVMIYPIMSGVRLKDLAQWYRQYGTLINAGLNFNQALTALADNTKNTKLVEITNKGADMVRTGGYFSDVMAAYPWVFPSMHLEMFRAAEHGGMMEDTLRQLGDYVEHELSIRSLVSRETLYPKIVLFALLMIMGLGGIRGGLPAIATLILGGTMRDYLMETIGFGLMLLLPILGLVVFFRLFAFNIVKVRHVYDEVKIKLPVVGKIIRGFCIAKFARTYSALSRAGFSSSSALQIAGDASGNVVFARASHYAAMKAEQGYLPSQALYETKQFTQMTIDMLRTAETSGSIDMMMDKVADYHELEAKASSHTVAMIFSVAVLLIVGLIVGSTVVGQYRGYAGAVQSAGSQ